MAQIDVDNSAAVKVADGSEMAGSNALIRTVGDDIYVGGSGVTDADGLLVKETDGIVRIPLDSGDVIFAVCLADGVNEQQVVTLGDTTGGTFPLTFSGQTTTDIPFDASSDDVAAALEALSNVGAGNVEVTGDAGGPWTVEFTGELAATNVAEMTTSETDLTGGTPTAGVATSVAGVADSALAAVVHTYVG